MRAAVSNVYGKLEYNNNDDNEEPQRLCLRRHHPLLTRRYILTLFIVSVIALLFLNQTTWFDYNHYLPLLPEEARVLCINKQIHVESDIGVGYLSYGGGGGGGGGSTSQVEMQLYMTSVTRHVECHHHHYEGQAIALAYTDRFLNISHANVDALVHTLMAQYPQGERFTAFYYHGCNDPSHRVLDVNCLSMEPLNREEYSLLIEYLALKFLSLVVVASIVGCVVFLHIAHHDMNTLSKNHYKKELV